ncbi:hypothetical protein ACE1OC_00335 [Streptomyces sp. DSM 116496]|uniref:hypothetical protein n=1 Tax=Streptomyces stoeckheimensis TaxID=3344656 RepID=UPI0038B2D5E5
MGHYADPAARKVAATLLPAPVLVQAALLSALTHLVPDADVAEMGFAARLTAAAPEAVGDFAAFLARATGSAASRG